MNFQVTCTMVLQTNNETKAGRYKNLVLKKIPLKLKVRKSELYYKDRAQWFFQLSGVYTSESPQNIMFAILGIVNAVFEVSSVQGPLFQENGDFSAFFVRHLRKVHGSKVHHCLEEFNIMVMAS